MSEQFSYDWTQYGLLYVEGNKSESLRIARFCSDRRQRRQYTILEEALVTDLFSPLNK